MDQEDIFKQILLSRVDHLFSCYSPMRMVDSKVSPIYQEDICRHDDDRDSLFLAFHNDNPTLPMVVASFRAPYEAQTPSGSWCPVGIHSIESRRSFDQGLDSSGFDDLVLGLICQEHAGMAAVRLRETAILAQPEFFRRWLKWQTFYYRYGDILLKWDAHNRQLVLSETIAARSCLALA